MDNKYTELFKMIVGV